MIFIIMASIDFDVIRERCPECDEQIMTHNKIMICNFCNDLYHACCSEKSFQFDNIKLAWKCSKCKLEESERYNPFQISSQDKYNPSLGSCEDDLNKISDILKNFL